jgi:hypothetical protein
MQRADWSLNGFVVLGVLGIGCILGALVVAPRMLLPHDEREAVVQQRGDARTAVIQQSDDERAALRRQVDEAERRWNDRGIKSYRIVVMWVGSTWFLQHNTVVVTNGQVTDSSSRCERTPAGPNPCRVLPFDPARYTVPGLFSTVRALLAPDPPSPTPDPPTIVKLTFDAVYGYPRTISSDQPPIIHADGFWRVEELEPL